MELLNLMADRPETSSQAAAPAPRRRDDGGAERFEKVLAGAVERDRDAHADERRPVEPTEKAESAAPVDENESRDDEAAEETAAASNPAGESESTDEGDLADANTKHTLSTEAAEELLPEIQPAEAETPMADTKKPELGVAVPAPEPEPLPSEMKPLRGDVHRALADAKPVRPAIATEGVSTPVMEIAADDTPVISGPDGALIGDDLPATQVPATDVETVDAKLAMQAEGASAVPATGAGKEIAAAQAQRESEPILAAPRVETEESRPQELPRTERIAVEAPRDASPTGVNPTEGDPERISRFGTERVHAELAAEAGVTEGDASRVGVKSGGPVEALGQTPLTGVEESPLAKESAQASATQRVAPARPTPPEALPERTLRIVQEMKATGQTSYKAEIRLDPPELGRMQIELNVEGERAWARLVVESAAAREQIRSELPQIRELLESQGLAEARVEVQLRKGGDQEQGEGNGKASDEASEGDESGADGAGRILRSAHDGVIDLRA